MSTFVSRSQWGARAPRNVSNNITPQNGGVTVHYVGAGNVARADHGDCAAQVRGIQNYHMDTNGWSDIAYTHLVCQHDHIFVGRGNHVRTAANGTTSGNQNWYAVCALVGAADNLTEGLLDAIRTAISSLRSGGGAADAINGHRDHRATSCPGDALYARVQDGSLDPDGDTGPPPWPGVYFTYPPVFRHPSVSTWQHRMTTLGYPLTADGAYGPQSKSACITFQRAEGLEDDGIVGPATWNATFADSAQPAPSILTMQ